MSTVVKIIKLIVLALLMAAVLFLVANLSLGDETVPFENLHIKQALPDYCYDMPRPLFEKWCDLQNRGAYRQAERLADASRARHPLRETYVQENNYKARVTQKQQESVSPNKASMSGTQDTDYRGNNVQRVYQSGEVSGGPVVVLNPYAPRPAAVLFKEDGTPYVADPDRTLLAWQAKRLLNEYLRSEEDWRFVNDPPLGGSDAE